MTTLVPENETLTLAVSVAREFAQANGGTVLDALLRLGTRSLEEWDLDLRAASQVAALDVGPGYEIDWAVLTLDQARGLRAIAVTTSMMPCHWVGLADPWDELAAQSVATALGRWPHFAAVTSAFLAKHLEDARPERSQSPEVTRSAVECVDEAMQQALEMGASDVHFECSQNGLQVRFRHDGVMLAVSTLATVQRAEEVISRIKVLAQLDITERRTPQDGRFRWTRDDRSVDLRVSIMPSIHGEDAVLRLLDRAHLGASTRSISLEVLGFRDAETQALRALARLPHGMMLITGPTGSGKTTTVYAALSELNTGLEKIITIEDPVEYELSGVLQIPVNERKGLTFAKGLRSILRHDPDRILVGEIRDAETAEIAVQSALTGHQVFTTVHANSIYDVMGRFLHFGIDMFGFTSSLNGVVVQRLVRRLCTECAERRKPSPNVNRWLLDWGVEPTDVFAASGCARCGATGYRGRIVIAEVHTVDDTLRDLVKAGAPMKTLRDHVESGPAVPLAKQAAMLVASGVTTPDEIQRIVGWL